MVPKGACSSQAALSYYYKVFPLKSKKLPLIGTMVREISIFPATWMNDFSKNSTLFKSSMVRLEEIRLRSPQEIFSELIRMFYTNLTCSNGVLTSEAKKHTI